MIWYWVPPALAPAPLSLVLVPPMYVQGTTHQVPWYHNPVTPLLRGMVQVHDNNLNH